MSWFIPLPWPSLCDHFARVLSQLKTSSDGLHHNQQHRTVGPTRPRKIQTLLKGLSPGLIQRRISLANNLCFVVFAIRKGRGVRRRSWERSRWESAHEYPQLNGRGKRKRNGERIRRWMMGNPNPYLTPLTSISQIFQHKNSYLYVIEQSKRQRCISKVS